MSTEPVRASAGWLNLREPADAAARSVELVDLLRPHLSGGRDLVVHDLGSGSGSMARWLAPRLPGQQHWILHDRDVELLALVPADPPAVPVGAGPLTFETRGRDITRLAPEELSGASLITASALLDMLTAEEMDRLVASCASAGCPVLITLSVVGRVELDPADPLDDAVQAAFNAAPATRPRRRPAARPRRTRLRGVCVRRPRAGRGRAPQPLAARQGPSRASLGLVRRLARRCPRAAARSARSRGFLPAEPTRGGDFRTSRGHRPPPGSARHTDGLTRTDQGHHPNGPGHGPNGPLQMGGLGTMVLRPSGLLGPRTRDRPRTMSQLLRRPSQYLPSSPRGQRDRPSRSHQSIRCSGQAPSRSRSPLFRTTPLGNPCIHSLESGAAAGLLSRG